MPNSKASVLHGEIKNLVLQYAKEFALDGLYPVGSVYFSVNNVSPARKLGGTWETIPNDTFMVVGSGNSANNSITLNSNQIPSLTVGNTSVPHRHTIVTTNQYATVCNGLIRDNDDQWVGGSNKGSSTLTYVHKGGSTRHNFLMGEGSENVDGYNSTTSHGHTYKNNNQQPINLSNSVKRITLYAWKRIA